MRRLGGVGREPVDKPLAEAAWGGPRRRPFPASPLRSLRSLRRTPKKGGARTGGPHMPIR